MHITARDVITTVCPAPTQFKKAQQQSDSEDDSEYGSDNFDGDKDEDEDAETVDFEANDVLGKLLALINQVCTFLIC